MTRIAAVTLLLLVAACDLPQMGQRTPMVTWPQDIAMPTYTAPLAPVPSPTETVGALMQPYTIGGLRQHPLNRGQVKVLSMAAKTEIYTRYLISYPSDSLNVTGVMQIPRQGRAPYPVIVLNHGFFNRSEYTPGAGTDRAAEYLNQHGYLTLASDYRSWGGSDTGPSLYYAGLAIDVANLLKAVPSIPEADATRVGMWGHSMGGAVTMRVLMLDTSVKAAVLYSTVSADDADVLARWGLGCLGDISAGEHQLGCNSSDIVPLDLPQNLIQAYYEASKDPNELQAMSPIYHLDLLNAPVEIHYGTQDGKVLSGTPPEWSEELFRAFQAAGKPAELFAYEGEQHSFNGDSWITFMERSAHFFDQYVKSPGP